MRSPDSYRCQKNCQRADQERLVPAQQRPRTTLELVHGGKHVGCGLETLLGRATEAARDDSIQIAGHGWVA
jgi:hypothetical protein